MKSFFALTMTLALVAGCTTPTMTSNLPVQQGVQAASHTGGFSIAASKPTFPGNSQELQGLKLKKITIKEAYINLSNCIYTNYGTHNPRGIGVSNIMAHCSAEAVAYELAKAEHDQTRINFLTEQSSPSSHDAASEEQFGVGPEGMKAQEMYEDLTEITGTPSCAAVDSQVECTLADLID
ncbi:MAG: hypothetical protein ACAI44_27065, partial [Candidatus Sericytochromatia bacterium]